MREGGLLLQNPIPLNPPHELEGKADRIFQYSFFFLRQGCTVVPPPHPCHPRESL